MRDRSGGLGANRRGVAFAAILALCVGLVIEPASAQEPSIGDRVGDFFKRLVPGGGGDQAQPPQPPAGPPPAAQAPQGQSTQAQPTQSQAQQGQGAAGPAPAAQSQPPVRHADPSLTDRVGDFFKGLMPGGGRDQAQSQQPPAAPTPAAQPPVGQAPAAQVGQPPPQGQQGQGQQVPAAQAQPGQPAAAQSQSRPVVRRADPSLTDRMGDFFKRLMPGSGSEDQAAALPAGRTTAGANPGEDEFDCPGVDIREGASTLMVQGQGESQALSLRYQASFVRAARECVVKGKDVTIKVGVQGRIILGPAGGPGELKIPLRYALVHEELGRSRMIWSKLYVLPVDIPGQQANVSFRHVEEDMTVPIPKASELENYIVYIGFDPHGLPSEQPKKPPPKPKKPPG